MTARLKVKLGQTLLKAMHAAIRQANAVLLPASLERVFAPSQAMAI